MRQLIAAGGRQQPKECFGDENRQNGEPDTASDPAGLRKQRKKVNQKEYQRCGYSGRDGQIEYRTMYETRQAGEQVDRARQAEQTTDDASARQQVVKSARPSGSVAANVLRN